MFGLTIAELLVASGILAVALVTMMVLFGALIQNTQKNSLLNAGVFFADSILEREVADAEARYNTARDGGASNTFQTFPTGDYPLDGSGFISIDNNAQNQRTEYLYRVEANQVDGFNVDDLAQVWKLTVEVRWWQDSQDGAAATRAGSGNLSIKQERMAYIIWRNR